jgi:acetyl esterase
VDGDNLDAEPHSTIHRPLKAPRGSGIQPNSLAESHYLADSADARNPYASPLLAEDLTGLPPALVMTAELDPLRDEGEAYARRLAEAGVMVEHIRWDGQFHGSQHMAKLIPDEAAAYVGTVIETLRRVYHA